MTDIIEDELKVAPRVGAWIETDYDASATLKAQVSHPVWVRGLKLFTV